MRVSIIIPCYNEQGNISKLVQSINQIDEHGLCVEYLLVDNGSTDHTGEHIDKFVNNKIKKVVVEKNQGFGYGIQCGIKAATGDFIGWIHGDMQVNPIELNQFFEYLSLHPTFAFFIKAHRINRTKTERFFTWGQGFIDSMIFNIKLWDISAFPVLYPAVVVKGEITDEMPNDFSIDLFAYKEALERGLTEVRFDVVVAERENGQSSWNTGMKSRIKQSYRIFKDSLAIRKGKKVL